MKHVMYSVGNVLGSIPGDDLSETWTTPLKDALGKKSNSDSNWGTTDQQANTEPLRYAGLLILIELSGKSS